VAGPDEHLTQSEAGRLEDLFLWHAGAAGRLAYLLTGDRELADDLVQDAPSSISPAGSPTWPSPLSPTGMKPIGWQPHCYAFLLEPSDGRVLRSVKLDGRAGAMSVDPSGRLL